MSLGETTTQFGIAGAEIYQLLGLFFDAAPPAGDWRQEHRNMQHHFVRLDHDYLPKPDLKERYHKLERDLGVAPLLYSYEHEVDPGRLSPLLGAWVAYVTPHGDFAG